MTFVFFILGWKYRPLTIKKIFLNKNIKALSLLCPTIVYMLYLAVTNRKSAEGQGRHALEIIDFLKKIK